MMSARPRLLESERIIQLADVEDLLQARADGIGSWLEEVGNSCRMEQKHCQEGTVERVYWHYGYMTALRDALDLLKRTAQPLS